jgi:hypothetical protein
MDRRILREEFDERTLVATLEPAELVGQAQLSRCENTAQEIHHAELTGPASREVPRALSATCVSCRASRPGHLNI